MATKSEHAYSRDNTICVFAQPRGGSTWFSNLLLSLPRSMKVDEPLSRGMFDPSGKMPPAGIGKIKKLDELNFYYHQPIPKGANHQEAEQFFDDLFRLKYRNPYLFEETSYRSMLNPELLIFKFNQGNLMLEWLVDKFQFTPIVLLRHPFSVIASQLSFYAFEKVRSASKYEIPEFRFHEYFDPYQDILASLKHPEEILAARWSMNYLPVNQPSKKWLTIHYENVIADPDSELEKIFTYIGRNQPDEIREKFYLPAFKNHHDKTHYEEKGSKESWKGNLTDEQIKRIKRVLLDFGITSYNGEEVK
ncbi:sulfotransferase domain-containing protein [Ekhidna lutea]|uniref:sulfotransferase domain-containing protein n=1 Tax=Ekhidna lutea TaxID=447679 RepID=UPI0015C6643E|nr:sulfotransferase domain-containing protein [Ekhidna lutea]